MMKVLHLLIVAVIVSLACFSVDGRQRKKKKRIEQKLKKDVIWSAMDEDDQQLVMDYCTARAFSAERNRTHASLARIKCIRRFLANWKYHCSHKSRENCKMHKKKMQQEVNNLATLKSNRREKVKSGKAFQQPFVKCSSTYKDEITPYDPENSICCPEGYVLPLPKPNHRPCCPSALRDCCLGCCGSQTYAPKKELCHDNRVYVLSAAARVATAAGVSLAPQYHPHANILHIAAAGGATAAGVSLAPQYHPHANNLHIAGYAAISFGILVSALVSICMVISILLRVISVHNIITKKADTSAEATLSNESSSDKGGNKGTVETTQENRDCAISEFEVKLSDLLFTNVSPGSHTVEGLTTALNKHSSIPDSYIAGNLYNTVQTQTSPRKQINICDSLGRPSQASIVATVEERVIQLPHSDVVMTLPGPDLQDGPIECYVSSITDLEAMRKKLKLSHNQRVSSPIAEYVLPNVRRLQEHAVIKLPVCGRSDNFRIIRAISDQGENEEFQEVYDIPVFSSKQEGMDIDTFCTSSKNKRYVLIFTKVFSVYLKVETGEKMDFTAVGYTFVGVSHPKTDLAIVTVNTYILGDLSVFKDFKKPLKNEEREFGRTPVDYKDLNFKTIVKSSESLEVYLNIDDSDDWDFVRDPRRPELDKEKQTVAVSDIIQSTDGFSRRKVSWEIENKHPAIIPSCFRCHVYIDHIRNSGRNDDGTAQPIFEQPVTKSTEERRRSNSRSSTNRHYSTGSSYRSSFDSSSVTNSQYSTNPEDVRKELNNTMPSSYYGSQGNQIRSPSLPKPMPELDKGVVCSYDQQSVPNRVSQYNNQ